MTSPHARLTALATATAIALAAMHAAAAPPGPPPGTDRVQLSGLASAPRHDRFIVRYAEGSAEHRDPAARSAALAVAGRAVAASRAGALAVRHERRMAVGADVIRTSRALDPVEAESLMRQLALNPNVEYVEVDRLNKPFLVPNDPRFSQQWGFGTTPAGIRATEAWDITTGAGAVVAVLDTGITSHADLAGNILPGYDFIVDTAVAGDGNGRDADASDPGDYYGGYNSSWHGTHVAGTVAALTNNNLGVAGTAPGAKVVPVRVLGRGGGYDSDIADAVVWASGGSVPGVPANANPAEAINLSLGGPGSCGSAMQSAINGAVSRGSTLVIAAGNDNANTAGFSPANCGNVIAVGSVTSSGARSSFSNYGAAVDIAAPGSDIMSTLNSGTRGPGTASYASYSGTSMAAPHVAGVVALVQSVSNPARTPAQVEALLRSTASPFPSTPSQAIGAGNVNARAAVVAAGGGDDDDGGGGGGGGLQNGVPVTGIAGGASSQQYWTVTVPAGASNLVVGMSGGTGDADLYLRAGSQPTTSSWDCRPYQAGNNETCSVASPQATTYHVMVRGYSAFSGVRLVASWSGGGSGGGGSQTYANATDVAIRDRATVESAIAVTGRSGNAPSSTPVQVAIVHTYRGDLKVDLVAPDGSTYVLHNRSGGSADNLSATYSVNLSSEAINGTWRLRVNDAAAGDTGYIDRWSITF
jgi:serine protease